MSKDPVASGGQTRPARTRKAWTADLGSADTVLATARKAFFVMLAFLILIWVIQIVNALNHYNLSHAYGIYPRDVGRLPDILTAPFLHASWTHIEGNSGPLFIFGFIAAYRGLGKFFAVTVVVILTSGLAAWFFEAPLSYGVGASGVVFGYFGYIMVRGLFDRHVIDVLVGAVMALCFAYSFAVLLPHQGIGWQAHVGGIAGGVASGWIFRDRGARARARAAGPASAIAPGTSAGAAIEPASPSGKQSGKKVTVDPSNPRAELYKQLDDMGL
ncbi:MAG TPA: rhomboid family intramembrane serine protease [Streptosporangiaceae bacterium]